jgi:hypothetical protein
MPRPDPEAAALELIVRLPIDLLAAEGLRSVLQDYAGVLHSEGVFAGMAWSDASRVAAAVVMDVCRRSPLLVCCLSVLIKVKISDRRFVVAAPQDAIHGS